MFESIESIDQALLLRINGAHTPFFDTFFWYISKTATIVPFYAAGLFFLYKYFGLKKATVFAIFALALVAVIDTSTTYLFKELVQRYRPSHHLILKEKLHFHILNNGKSYQGGQYGFFSSHAGNNLGIAVFLGGLLWKKNKRILQIGIFVSLLIGYSRMYLGVHYPSDVVCGFLWGTLWAILFHTFLSKRTKLLL